MKKNIARLSVLAGIIIFVVIIYTIGPEKVWQSIKQISLESFLILVLLRILYWALRTISWKVVLDEYEGRASLMNLFIARMCGHAVSQLTPTAQVGSETTRIFMADCSDRKISVASVVVDKTIEFLTVIAFTLLGVFVIFFRIPLPPKFKTVIIGGASLATILVLFLFFKQKKGLLTWIIDSLAKIKIRPKFLERNREKIRETDEQISIFYRKHPGAFLKVFFLYSLLIMLWVTEIHLNLLFIGANISWLDSFIVTALGNLAFIFPFIPGSIGIYEVTYVTLFVLLGQGPEVGLTLVLIRRIIALLLAGFGLLGMLKPAENK
jgi:uncharacterized protein (TIRG00374 family)